MGFFSWTCAKTHLPILASPSWDHVPELTEVTLLRPGHPPISGDYDGYGRLAGLDLMDQGIDGEIERGTAKLVLSEFYRNEPFEALDRSYREPGQGHFHDEKFLKDVVALAKSGSSFKSYEGYALSYEGIPVAIAAALDSPTAKAIGRIVEELESDGVGRRELVELVRKCSSKVKGLDLTEPEPKEDDDLTGILAFQVAVVFLAKGVKEGERSIRDVIDSVPAPKSSRP